MVYDKNHIRFTQESQLLHNSLTKLVIKLQKDYIIFKKTMTIITVTTNADQGEGSLREAITKAQSGDTIKFDASLTDQTITLNRQIGIQKSLTIDGSDAPGLTISGGEKTNIFRLAKENESLTVRNLTLADSYDEAAPGGAIWAIDNSTVALLQLPIVPLTVMTEQRSAINPIAQGQLVYLPMEV